MKIEIIYGNIVEQKADAIVNAANHALLIGGGVDGAIHSKGGSDIREYTKEHYPEGCPTGEAVISCAGDLQAQYVIHAVGPVWYGGTRNESELLRSAYQHALTVADLANCQTIAFPSISTGAYGYPVDEATNIALETILNFEGKSLQTAKFVVFHSIDHEIAKTALFNLLSRN